MIENRCIMPVEAHPLRFGGMSQEDINIHHRWFQQELVDRFGGYTISPGRGSWRDDQGFIVVEGVIIYDVAMENTPITEHVFVKLCEELGKRLNQDCVYVRLVAGVRLIPIHQKEFV